MVRMMERLRSLLPSGGAASDALEKRLDRIEADIEGLRRLIRRRDDNAQRMLRAGFSSMANLLSILPALGSDGVIPPFPHLGFEITGEEAAYLFHLVRRRKPGLILELGSGSSTFLFAAALKANGSGRLISVEHESDHAERTTQFLDQAGLLEWVELVTAPLVEQQIGERSFAWYELAPLLARLKDDIDLLFVDGPQGKKQSLSRYPALPVLAPHLAPQAIVFVDDGGREDETRMIELWRELDDVAFASETLSFLPRAPVLLTMASRESRVAELHPLKGEEPEATEAGADFAPERRSGTS